MSMSVGAAGSVGASALLLMCELLVLDPVRADTSSAQLNGHMGGHGHRPIGYGAERVQ